MNYLAHLHLAEQSNTSLLGNFLGDFVKGSPEGKYSDPVIQGIRLHRFVDSFTDQHVIVKSLKQFFPQELRRFAPISLDMFWDHCLAKNWSVYHQSTLIAFCQRAEKQMVLEMQDENNPLPTHFMTISETMWQGRWLEHYADIDNILFALQRIARRSDKMAPLGATGDVLLGHYELFADHFLQFYPELLQQTRRFVANRP